MKRLLSFTASLLLALLLAGGALAQADSFGPVRAAIRGSNSRELAQLFAPTVELSFDGDKQRYSATQAEFVMKDFFAKHPSASFDFDHYGGSKEGTVYAAGPYTGKTGVYSMFVKMKPVGGSLRITTIDFNKE